ncbi:MAG: hypothetical protein EA381_10860 [Planctomycetaceae bacterium]|nr:MAG: hypothetical protein EA381_10860 [Planctomycetaceae bacterium]
MSIRKSKFRPDPATDPLSGLSKSSAPARPRRGGRRVGKRGHQGRRTLLETLESRQLLAGPNLVGIQPNQNTLLFDGIELNSAPRELVFRFDDSAPIDPATLDGIRITRAGADGVFESAIATSDLGTGNQVLLEFRAKQPGTAGEGLQVRFTTSFRTGGAPIIAVNNGVIDIDLNSNPARPTQVRDLILGVANHPVAGNLLEVFSVSGATLFPLGTTVPTGTSLTLLGANAADATSDLGTSGEVRVRFVSTQPGPEGRATRLVLERVNAGGPANPLILVSGNQVTVRINSTPGFQTTTAQLIDAINTNPDASQLVFAVQEAGSPATILGNRPGFAQTLLLTGANDILVEPGYIGLGDSPNEVVFRFADSLPDDKYQIDIFGNGPTVLANVLGEPFNDGVNFGKQFSLNLGPRVAAVVPEPIRRGTGNSLSPEVGVIEVHFSERMNLNTVVNRNFYQLIFTKDTASTLDDVTVLPTSVTYNQATNIARLVFDGPLARLPNPAGGFLTGAARLRIGDAQTVPTTPPTTVQVNTEPGDSFATAFALPNLGTPNSSGFQAIRLESEVRNTTDFGLQFPGGPDAQGVRQIRPEDPSRLDRPVPLDFFRQGADDVNGITTIQYNFPSTFRGDDPSLAGIDDSKTYFNLITAQQRQRVREVLSLFSEYLGIQFVEVTGGPTQDAFFSIAVGDLYGANPLTTSGPGGLAIATRDRTGNGLNDLVVLDFQDFQQSTDDQFGGPFFRGAMLAIGQVIGFGFADSLPQPVTQSSDFIFNPGTSNEPTYPSVSDIVNGQFLYRPDSTDIDLYRFQLTVASKVSIQTFAERLPNASMLDTHLRLYQKDVRTGAFVEIAQNDDYFSNDSLIELDLRAGEYMVGVSASGNDRYDPNIPGSGLGGRSEGAYELRITTQVTPQAAANQRLTDATGVELDGNNDGTPGGVYDFWFVPADQSNTLYVDKAATSQGNGTLAQPFRNLNSAIAQATPGTTIRMVANGGADGKVETPEDNFSYQIGFSPTGNPLPDGTSLNVPRGVRLVIDAGVVIKMRQARIGVGSTTPSVDRSDSAIQILGTPVLIGADGLVARDAVGEPIPGSVIITSYNDTSAGRGNVTGTLPQPRPGDWGGIDLRSDIDFSDSARRNRENEGVFLNHIQFADLRYGGGQVSVDGRQVIVSPIDMALTRATVTNSVITRSADAAIAATPDTFRETRFDEAAFQQAGAFTPVISRVGPDIHGNRIVDNSINGLFIRITTRTGDTLQPLTTSARFDDTDIVHVLAENLVVQGNPGGGIAPAQAPSMLGVQAAAATGIGEVPAGEYVYRLTFSSPTTESDASTTTLPVVLTQAGEIRLTQLPTAAAGSGFTARRLYRATLDADGQPGTFRLVATLNATNVTYVDRAATGTVALPPQVLRINARPDARLAIDPGTVVKLGGARIDVTFGADLIAEGTADAPVVFTSLQDRRYGAGGTFETNSVSQTTEILPGDWGGLYIGHTSSASLDHAVIAGGGGTTRIPGGFASFNAIEVHQGQLRLANSRMELNADGRGFIDGNQLDRAGRGENASGGLFVRGAQPIVVNNTIVDSDGPALTFDVNSFVWHEVADPGRATGMRDAVISTGNSGPLVSGNRLENNSLNGMEIRGGQVATEVVWDDVDIVHIVRDTIEVPNQHVYGGLRLASDNRGSLVVKFGNTNAVPATGTTPAIPARVAGIVVGGSLTSAAEQFVDIADRIGGSLQVVGHADFPVVLTALADDSIGAGFTPSGLPQTNTNNSGEFETTLPTIPQVDRGNLIDNNVPRDVPGFFEALIGTGNEVLVSGVTLRDGTGVLVAQDYIFQYSTFVTTATGPELLALTQITQQPTLIAADTVESRGIFAGPNGDVQWIATSFFLDGVPQLFSNLQLESLDGNPLGDIQVVSYLDQDVPVLTDNILYTVGTPGTPDFRVFTVDNNRRIGFSHGGFYVPDGFNLAGATYTGWAADSFPLLLGAVANGTQTFSIDGDINLANLPAQADFSLGTFFGPEDVTTAFAWNTDPTATQARITSFLELLPEDPNASGPRPGSWNGILVREAAGDRNVLITTETESRTNSRSDANSVPSQSQFLGELASGEEAGDENRRLGFIVEGTILTNDDVDVFSFIGEAGTQVWLDIDRTSLGTNLVLELIDTNGMTLVLSDSSLLESRGDMQRLTPAGSSFDPANARSLNVLPIPAGSPTSAYQDDFSVNPNDPGMRVILPGLAGQRNLYHVRVRSSNVVGSDRSRLLDPGAVRGGLTSGSYQLQVRLREADETPGTQIRFADVRFATHGVQVVGGPINGPLVGDVSETTGPNNTIADAQPLGLFEVGINLQSDDASGPLNSNRLSKTVAGFIDAVDDVDWYRFDIRYENLTRDDASMFLATIFDLDYADGFARGDLAIHVFNEAGQLVLRGTDSNVADDQPTGVSGADNTDLNRGSAGSLDPYIGVAELPEGRYFVAISNQSQIPAQLDQFSLVSPTNPLLRLEPIDAIIRIVEDRIGDPQISGAVAPMMPRLFDPQAAVVPLELRDLVMYSITGGGTVRLLNPFTGQNYGALNEPEVSFLDMAFLPNGELFAYSVNGANGADDGDVSYNYFRISSETGALTNLGLSGMQTFHLIPNPNAGQAGQPPFIVEDSDDGFNVQAMTFVDNFNGLVVGNRPFQRAQLTPAANAYSQNIIYRFEPQTGQFTSLPRANRVNEARALGAGTQVVERGYIETGPGFNPDGTPRQAVSNQLVVPAAVRVNPNGTTTPLIQDGSVITLQSGLQSFRLEMDSGPMLEFNTDPVAGNFARELFGTQPVRFSLTDSGVTTVYELDSGPVIVINAAQIVDGANVRITDANGVMRVFEFNSNGVLNNPAAVSVDYIPGQTNIQLAAALAAAINNAGMAAQGFATPGQGRVDLVGDSTTAPPMVFGSGLSVVGAAGSTDPNVVLIPIRENFTGAELAEAIAAATGGSVGGNRVNWRNVTVVNITNLSAINVAQQVGTTGVASGNVAVRFLAGDTAGTIAERIAQVVNTNPTLQAAGIGVTVNGNTLVFENALLNAGNNTVAANFTVAGVPPGGTVTGISMVGQTLYAVSTAGGLYAVGNPLIGNSFAAVPGQIGTYISTATDLVGLNFSGLTTGPTNVPGLLDAAGNPLLFGSASGPTGTRLYAFDTLGRLQPVFAGGATSVQIAGGVSGIDLSTLDFNLWHVTGRRALDEGHGIGVRYNDVSETPTRVPGGSSFYFGAEPLDPRIPINPDQSPFAVPRQDGQPVEGTYNFPGGAKGALESLPFSLAGYSSADLPTLYFNYFLETDGVDGLIESDNLGTFGRDQDAFRVFVVDERGVSYQLATNNLATSTLPGYSDEFDNPGLSANPLLRSTYSPDGSIQVQPLFDNTETWRQARISLSDFAGQENLRLRLEFSTSGSFSDGSPGLRVVSADQLVDGARFVVGGQTFEIDLGATLLTPAGSQIAAYYALAPADPLHRVTVDVGGVTYVLNDGTRSVGPDEVNVPLLQTGDGPVATLTAETIAGRLAEAIRTNGLPTQIVPFNFNVSGNDELSTAARLPRVNGDVLFSGGGMLNTALDVDLFRIDLPAGATLRAGMTAGTVPFLPNVRIFDLAGNELADGTGEALFTTDTARSVVIGFSSGANIDYNPGVAGTGTPGVAGNYTAEVEVTADLRVIQTGVRLNLTGGVSAATGPDGLVGVTGQPGVAMGLPVVLDASMSSVEVALEIQRAIANRFSRGVLSAYPIVNNQITLTGLTIQEIGPFARTGLATGDRFGNNGVQMARANAFEGVYVDDFIIGFAERGEMAFNATGVADFIADPNPAPGVTARPTTGSYQLEIRDASEYLNSLTTESFRGFDTNARLAEGVAITALPAGQVIDGATFQLTDGVTTITFEMDLVDADGNSDGVRDGRVRVPFPAASTLPPGRDGSIEVADAIAEAINSPTVRGLIDVAAVAVDGIDTRGNNRLNLFGDVIVLNFAGVLSDVTRSELRGDQNRDRTGQGVILIENSRFSYNSEAGIQITRDATSASRGPDAIVQTPTVLTHPRNLVALNTLNQIPGVVVQSNVLAFNTVTGIEIIGLANNGLTVPPVGFDKILNNTVFGGFIRPAAAPEPAEFSGVLFPAGELSFADAVVSFAPGPGVSPGFNNPQRALGPPQLVGRGDEPLTGDFTTSLGRGGVLTLAFTENFLTGSGDARPDLAVFEVGEIESVRVEISRDGVTFFDVGVVGGITNTIDIDAFGFGPQDRFSFVRLTDLRQGTALSGPVGADIDAVGAISTVPRDVYVAGGEGISVRQNAAPTLLNNVLANNQTGLVVDTDSLLSVVGGTTYYRNSTNVNSTQSNPLGLFNQVLSDSLDLFVDPLRLSFTPRAGTPIIDSSIDSLEDRVSIATVKNAIGIPPSPIIAPRFDANGQLRVDDPTVASPIGIGEQVFKDRGGEERADQVGPRAILISPRADDLGTGSGQVETALGTIYDSFDIQLIDGIGPVDPTPGSGIDDSSVTSDGLLLTRDGVPLVEGRDYRFGYDASSNTIRLTPIAGIWQNNSVYVARLLDSTDAVLRMLPGASYVDGATTTLLTLTNNLVTLEAETGISIDVNTLPAFGNFDAQGLRVFDGNFALSFELDTDGFVRGDTLPVVIPTTATSEQIATALAAAINGTALNLTARALGTRIQLLGPSSLTTVTSLLDAPQIFQVSGEIGTQVGFGIGVPSENGLLAPSVTDGQVFRILRGASLVRTFEIDFGNGTFTPGAIPVLVGANPSVDAVADALVRAIGGAGLGLDPVNVGQGRVTLGGDANYALDLANTGLFPLGVAGQPATIPVVIPIDATAEEVAEIYGTAIIGSGIPGVTFATVGDRLVLDGVAGASGTGAIASPVVRDRVGNLLQSNREGGVTELTVFVGGGFNFGNAPASYGTLLADNGARHRVDSGFSLGPTVSPDADAIIPEGSSNDGVFQVGTASPGFPAQFTIDVRSDGRPFYVDAWIDWNGNGTFDANEVTRFKSANAPGNFAILGTGVNFVSLQVPAGTVSGSTWGRFRLSETIGLGPIGQAESGEVEDIRVIVQANPFQNPLNRFDVNQSGTVTPLDALNILNLLATYVNQGNQLPIPLNPPPSSLPDLVSGRFLPDVNGSGAIEPIDALLVINEIARDRLSGEGEGEVSLALAAGSNDAGSFVRLDNGLFASPLTAATQSGLPAVERPESLPESGQDTPQEPVSSSPSRSAAVSVFDSPELISLDDILDDLAVDQRNEGSDESVDAVFAGLGLGW